MSLDPGVRAAVQEWAGRQVRGSFPAPKAGWCPKCDKHYPQGRTVAYVRRRQLYPDTPRTGRDVLLCEPCAAQVVNP
jgi:hypothetical protein